MKTAKYIALTLMCVTLIATAVMGYILLDRVMGLLMPAAPSPDTSVQASSSESAPSSTPPSVPPTSIPATVHRCDYTIKGETYSPTCDMMGYTVYRCECGEEDYRDYVDSTGHLFGDYTVVPPTCSVDGWTERVCSQCKQTERIDFTTAPHTFTDWEATEYPNQESRKCTGCGGTQIHSTESGSTWEVMAIPMGNVSKHAHFKIEITSTTNSKVLDHHIYVSPKNTNIHFDYVNKELLVYYTYQGEEKVQVMASNSVNLTLRSDGVPKAREPWYAY